MGKTIHGQSKTRLYKTWKTIKQRCYNPNNPRYYVYGEKGITLCDEWHDFMVFKKWADTNGYEDSLSIDRVDPEKGYYPENCQWITYEENHQRMMEHNLNKGTGLFSDSSRNKSKDSLRKKLGKQCCLIKDGSVVSFNSRSEAVDYLVSKTGRDKVSLKTHLRLCIKGACKTISGYQAKEEP